MCIELKNFLQSFVSLDLHMSVLFYIMSFLVLSCMLYSLYVGLMKHSW